jgi:CRP/FNR family cyclic AMP-dependent transcriptional regulator
MLDKVALFSGLSQDALEALERHSVVKRYRRSTVIVEKGDESNNLYVLLSGKIRVYLADDSGKEIVLETAEEPGAHFGELALLLDRPRTASVETLEDSRFIVISRSSFLESLEANPQIAIGIMRYLADKVEHLTERVGSLALDDVYGRLAKALGELAREEDGRLITPRVTQQELAQMIGATREMVSRIFKELKAGEYIALEDKRVVINRKLPARW